MYLWHFWCLMAQTTNCIYNGPGMHSTSVYYLISICCETFLCTRVWREARGCCDVGYLHLVCIWARAWIRITHHCFWNIWWTVPSIVLWVLGDDWESTPCSFSTCHTARFVVSPFPQARHWVKQMLKCYTLKEFLNRSLSRYGSVYVYSGA